MTHGREPGCEQCNLQDDRRTCACVLLDLNHIEFQGDFSRRRYSCRKVLIGSIRLARRAGTKLARRAASTSTGIVMAKVDGSAGCIPATWPSSKRAAAKAPARPTPTPARIIPRL